MKSVETEIAPLGGNPIHVNGYLVFGDGRPARDGFGFEAWFWISQPHRVGDGWETLVYRRYLRNTVYKTEGEAVMQALSFGRHEATEMSPGRFVPAT